MATKTLYDDIAMVDTGSKRDQDSTIVLKKFHNQIKSQLYNEFSFHAKSLLDIGCGRGGDLYKWHHANIQHVIAIDQSPKSLEEAKNRYAQMRTSTVVEFAHVESFGKKDFILSSGSLDAISCMFALHYFFETEAIIHQTMKNVARNLKIGGSFFGCLPHGLSVVRALNHKKRRKTTCMDIESHFGKKKPQCFASSYSFALTDTVTEEKSVEFLVFENVLTTIAGMHGLEPVLNYKASSWKNLISLEEDTTGVFKHFAPSFAHLPDQEEASRIFVGEKMEYLEKHKQQQQAKIEAISIKTAMFYERVATHKREQDELQLLKCKRRKIFEAQLEEEYKPQQDALQVVNEQLQKDQAAYDVQHNIDQDCDCREIKILLFVLEHKKVFFPEEHWFTIWLQTTAENSETDDWDKFVTHLHKHDLTSEYLRKTFEVVEQKASFHLRGHVDGYKGDETHFEPCDDEPPSIVRFETHHDAIVFNDDYEHWDFYYEDDGEIEWPDHKSSWAKKTIIRDVDVVIVKK